MVEQQPTSLPERHNTQQTYELIIWSDLIDLANNVRIQWKRSAVHKQLGRIDKWLNKDGYDKTSADF